MPIEVNVSNPTYSIHRDGGDDPILASDRRYAPAGVLAPKSKADMAFIMHSLYCLDNSGTAAIVCFPGIFYRKNAEQRIRKYMVDNNFVDAVVQLPPNLFFGTSIATCILVLKKSRKASDIMFIDASDEFVKLSSDNTLSKENIENIVSLYADRRSVDHKAAVVPRQAVADKDYNLSVSSYVEKEDTRPPVDIKQVNAEIARLEAEGVILRAKVDSIVEAIEAKRND
jgi:type I restriction enzyme M protein